LEDNALYAVLKIRTLLNDYDLLRSYEKFYIYGISMVNMKILWK